MDSHSTDVPSYRGRGNESDDDEPARSRANHPAGKGSPGACASGFGTHRVVEGDTLWDIAAAVLKTDDVSRIARYWPAIHRANREVIGRDPNLIFPGTLLRLPVECRATRP